MDTLTGSHDFYEDNLKPLDSDRYQGADQKTITDFLEGRCYFLNPELFILVSNLDPREVSDRDFLRAAEKFSDQDFVRAAFLAYFKYEPSFYDFNFWTKEIKIRKGDRSYFLDKLRKSEQFFAKIYKSKTFSPLALIGKIFIRRLEILEVINLCYNNDSIFWGGWIDSPKQGDKPKGPTITIDGWVMGKQSQVVIIRLMSKSKSTTIAETPVNLPRPDVSHAYCLVSNYYNWGFRLNLMPNKIPVEPDFLIVEAVFEDGTTAPAAIILARK